MSSGIVWRIYVGFVADIDIKIWGAPSGPSMPFLDSDTCAEGGYLSVPGFSFLYNAIHGWIMRRIMDERVVWWKSFTKNDHNVLYYM
jgi:hypothetical protein